MDEKGKKARHSEKKANKIIKTMKKLQMTPETALKLNSVISGIFGQSMIGKITNNPKTFYKIFNYRYFYTITLIIALTLMQIYHITKSIPNTSDITILCEYIFWWVADHVGSIIAPLSLLLRQKELLQVVNSICFCYKEFDNLGYSIPSSHIYLIYIVLLFLPRIIRFYLFFETCDFTRFIEILGPLYLSSSIEQFGLYVLVNAVLFQTFNMSLKKVLKEESPTDVKEKSKIYDLAKQGENGASGNSNEIIENIKKLRSLYAKIHFIPEELTEVFKVNIFWDISHLTMLLIFTGYQLTQAKEDVVLKMITYACELLITLIVVYPCSKAISESEDIRKTIAVHLATTADKNIIDQLNQFTMILHENVSFSPFNMFQISNGLLLSIIGSAITYIVILSQIPRS